MNQSPKKIDTSLLFVVLCLLTLGLVMVYSASIVMPNGRNGELLIRQFIYILVSVLVARFLFPLSLWHWARWAKRLFLLVFTMLLVAAFSPKINGAHRWIQLGFINIQPSEFFKLWVILYMASFFQRKTEVLNNYIKAMLAGLAPTLGCCVMVFLNKDLGSALVVLFLMFAMLYLIKLPLKLLGLIGLGMSVVITPFIIFTGRLNRFVSLSPFDDEFGRGAQAVASALSTSNGGWFGNGLGNGIFKRGFLVEAHNDFIFSVITEELGWVMALILVSTYIWLIFRAVRIAMSARKLQLYFNSFVAIGISLLVAAQSFVHIGANLIVLPNKGLTLPLISYGGSSMFVMIMCCMLLLRVDYENRRTKLGFDMTDPKYVQTTQNPSS